MAYIVYAKRSKPIKENFDVIDVSEEYLAHASSNEYQIDNFSGNEKGFGFTLIPKGSDFNSSNFIKLSVSKDEAANARNLQNLKALIEKKFNDNKTERRLFDAYLGSSTASTMAAKVWAYKLDNWSDKPNSNSNRTTFQHPKTIRHSYTVVYQGDELYHHGVLGMKWGVRRYQNEDGSLTDAGRKRYEKGKARFEKSMEDATNHRKRAFDYVKNGHKTISDLAYNTSLLDYAQGKQKEAEKIAKKIEKKTGQKLEISNEDKKALDDVMKYYSKKSEKEIAKDKVLSFLTTFASGIIGGIVVNAITLNKGNNLSSQYKLSDDTKKLAVTRKEKKEFEKDLKTFMNNPANIAAMATRVNSIHQQQFNQFQQQMVHDQFMQNVMQQQLTNQMLNQIHLQTVTIPQHMMY